jgi:curved DNA-binding protein CbpA
MRDLYAILGVLPSIEPEALRSVYLALVKKSHPDVFSGNRNHAEHRSKNINEAYQILSNPVLRRKYDEEYEVHKNRRGDFSFEDEASNGAFDIAEIDEKWNFAESYHPELKEIKNQLARISRSLVVSFKFTILETKNFSSASGIADALKREYMRRYFGSNKLILDFAEVAVRNFRRDVALETNKAILILGDVENDHQARILIQKISSKLSFDLHEERENIRKAPKIISEEYLMAYTEALWLDYRDPLIIYLNQIQSGFLQVACVDGVSYAIEIHFKGNILNHDILHQLDKQGFKMLPEAWDGITLYEKQYKEKKFDLPQFQVDLIAACRILGVLNGNPIVCEAVQLDQKNPITSIGFSWKDYSIGLTVTIVTMIIAQVIFYRK